MIQKLRRRLWGGMLRSRTLNRRFSEFSDGCFSIHGRVPGAVIFDMDGVIVDTEPVYFRSNALLFESLGFSVSEEDYAQFVGLDAAATWSLLKARHALPHPIEDLVRMEAEGMVAGLATAEINLMPGLLPLLEGLVERRMPVAVASSSSHRVIDTIMARTGLGRYYKTRVSGDDVGQGKPAPDIFLWTAGRLGIVPADCVVIEDSANGVRAARAAGMMSIGLRNPNSGAQDLSAADLVVESLEAIRF